MVLKPQCGPAGLELFTEIVQQWLVPSDDDSWGQTDPRIYICCVCWTDRGTAKKILSGHALRVSKIHDDKGLMYSNFLHVTVLEATLVFVMCVWSHKQQSKLTIKPENGGKRYPDPACAIKFLLYF